LLNSAADSSPAVHEGESFDYRRLAATHANPRAAKLEGSPLIVDLPAEVLSTVSAEKPFCEPRPYLCHYCLT
jgi:hypothetical protein